MKKTYLGIILVLISIALAALSLWNKKEVTVEHDKLKVVTSFYPLYFFAQEIAGDSAEIINITPSGAEPHDYEPTVENMSDIESSDLVLLNGAGLEPWAEDMGRIIKKDATRFVYVGETSATIEGLHEEEHTEERHEEATKDPHVWLSPVLAQSMVDTIAQAFMDVDPAHASLYRANTQALKEKLNALDSEFRNSLKECKKNSIVTSHAAFAYLVREYNLKQVAIAGISPDEEPSAQAIVDIARYAKENSISYIFFETLVSPKLAQTIAREVGAQTLVLNPLEGLAPEEIMQHKNYISVMKENLNNLKVALECAK